MSIDRKLDRVTPDQAYALGGRKDGADQRQGDVAQPVFAIDRRFHGSASRRLLKIGPLDFDSDGAPPGARLLVPDPDVIDHRQDASFDLDGIDQVLRDVQA